MRIQKLLAIIQKYLTGTASAAEEKAIDKWYESADRKTVQPVPEEKLSLLKEESYNNIIGQLGMRNRVIPFYKRASVRVAATVLILLGAGSYFLFFNNTKNVPVNSGNTVTAQHDVAPPKNNKAILTLADGTKIELDSSGKGTLAMQGNVNVVKKENDVIVYNGSTTETAYNTLYVPKGSKPLKLALADGSLVWLNVSSSITYPVAFTGKERKVEISGEAYFEITKNASMPFIVKKVNGNTEIKVLGTHFNVNAYNDEEDIKVTLLEGSVKVGEANTQYSKILSPGQQAQVTSNKITVSNNVDMEEVMAWKDGRFYFDGASISSIMRQVEKWYDVDIQYDTDVKYSFVAKISRDVNVSELLKIFELTDLVHFKIEGKKIIVMK